MSGRPGTRSSSRPTCREGSGHERDHLDTLYSSARDLGLLLKARKITSEALTRAYLDRLEKVGPKLNAVVTVMRDSALKEAKQADAEIKAGKYKGPLHGVPYGAKDLLATKGAPTTWGAEPLRKAIATYLNLERGAACTPEQILVLSSTRQALFLCAQLLVDAGKPILLENPGYYGARKAFESAEAREELVRLTGRMSIPVIVVDGQVVVGFDKTRLERLLASP